LCGKEGRRYLSGALLDVGEGHFQRISRLGFDFAEDHG
jgi:hypothetical protein